MLEINHVKYNCTFSKIVQVRNWTAGSSNLAYLLLTQIKIRFKIVLSKCTIKCLGYIWFMIWICIISKYELRVQIKLCWDCKLEFKRLYLKQDVYTNYKLHLEPGL